MMRFVLFFVFVIISNVSYGQNFKQINITQNLTDPRLVETVDLDGDTLDEMLVASSEGLYLYHNQDSSQFEKRNLLDSIQGVFRFSLFDWGGDGDLDIFFTTFSPEYRIAWLENTGAMQFTYHLITDTIVTPYYIEPFDLDKDNDDDILVSSSSTDQLYWLKNDGQGGFSVDTIGDYVNQFEIADLNGDNDWDIIFGRTFTGIIFSEVRAFQNDGNNNFTMQVLRTGFSVIHEVIVEDINGDNFFDILVPDYNNDRISWLRNDGNYGFANQSIIINNFDGPSGIDLKDVNGDGRKDVIAGSYNADEIRYFQGQGSPSSYTFSGGTLLFDGLNSIGDLTIGNFDNQNNFDFAHTDIGTDELSVWTNSGNQTFTQDRLAFSFDSPRAFDMQDLDGDGDQDVAAVSNDGDMVAWMENVGNDIFETHILATNYEEPYAVRINDLDDDGDFDIVACSNNDDRVTWWRNDGPGNFTMIQIATNLNGPRDFWIEDFDGDGDKDIAVICFWLFSKSGFTGAQWLQNDGNENFTRIEIEDDIRAGGSIRGADLNGDTLVDLVISSYLYTGSELNMAINTGTGFYDVSIDDLLCEDFELVDFDNDGDTDILAIDFSLDSLYFYENTGSLQFQKHTLTYFQDLYGISPRDFDGDGDIDILFNTGCNCFTNGSGFEWGIFRNNGNSLLTTEVWYQNLSLIRAMETFDYELDGDYDVVIGFDFADRITMYKNLDVDCYLSVDIAATGNTSFCAGDSVLLNAITSDTGVSFQWYRNDVLLPNDTAAQLLVDSTGAYRVAITDTACSTFSKTQQVIVGAGYNENIALSFCQNDSLVLDSLTITAPGTYTVNYSSALGCDSTVNYQVNQIASDSVYLTQSICNGEAYQFNGQQISQSGIYAVTLPNRNGCDSLFTLNLQVLPTYTQNETLQVCSGDSVLLPGGYWAASAGNYVDTLQTSQGCDSVIQTQLLVNQQLQTTDSFSICHGDSIFINGQFESTSGVYVDTLQSQGGCDSIYTASLNILQHVSTNVSAAICQGDSILIGNTYQSQAGIYYDTLIAANTCDSVVVTSLSVTPTVTGSTSTSICQGDSIVLGSAYRKLAGVYVDTLQSAQGCDSLFSTTLTVLASVQQTVSLAICQGDSVLIGGSYQNQPGVYYDTLVAANTCDSIVVTNLAVNPVSAGNAFVSICQGDSIFLAGAWQTVAGNYIDSLTAANGCDSILSTTLTVLPAYNTTSQISICRGDSAFLGGSWQTNAGTYVDVYATTNQCDSTVTTQLTVTTVDTTVSRSGNTLMVNAVSAAYQWLDCNANYTPIAGATNATFIPSVNGSYAAQITQNGCIDTSQCFVVSNIGLDESETFSDIVVFPNPSSGIITISGKLDGNQQLATLIIIDASGSSVLELPIELNSNELNTRLDLSELPNGVYQLKINAGNSEVIRPIVVAK